MAPNGPVEKFARLLAAELGFALRPESRARLERVLGDRAASATRGDAEAYLSLLAQDSPAARAEWQEVLRELTIGESFFFRDAAQLRLLRETLLPDLLRRRAAQRSLRVWSAGCSTGEEPYSLAILVHELLPDIEGWDACIVGTEVNEAALAGAATARAPTASGGRCARCPS